MTLRFRAQRNIMYKMGIGCTRKITENAAHIMNGAKNAGEK